MFSKVSIPLDGRRRFCLNTWQPLATLTLAIAACITLVIYSIRSPWNRDRNSNLICNASGDIDEILDNHDPIWDLESYFSINVPVFTDLPFTKAKALDACWDLGIGKGGQALAGIVAYRAVRQSIKLTMEKRALPISTVTSVCSQQQVQAWSVWELIRAAFTRLGSPFSREKAHLLEMQLRMVACIFASIYVLSFATMTSVMTGYFTDVQGFYGSIVDSARLEALSSFHRADLLFLDTGRVAWTNPGVGLGAPVGISNRTESGSNNVGQRLTSPLLEYWRTCLNANSDIFRQQSKDWDWHFNVEGDIIYDSFMVNESSPEYFWECPSRICSCYFPRGSTKRSQMRSNITLDEQTFELGAPPLNFSVRVSTDAARHIATYRDMVGSLAQVDNWVRDDSYTDFSYEKLRQSANCIPDKRYSWGFSIQMLLTFVIYTLLFAITLVVMQVEVYWQGRWGRLNQAQSHSMYSDILTIASCFEAKFGPEIKELSVKDLNERISSHKGGVRLQTEGLPLSRGVTFRENALHQAMQAGNEEAGEELAILTAKLAGKTPETSPPLTTGEGIDLTTIDPAYLAVALREEREGRAESLLSGLEDEISRIHSQFSSDERSTLLPSEGSNDVRELVGRTGGEARDYC